MKKVLYTGFIATAILFTSCKKDKDFLNIPSPNIISLEQTFSDPNQAVSVLGELYNRVPDLTAFKNGWESFVDPGEAIASTTSGHVTVTRNAFGYGLWSYWDYTYIRELNLFIERATNSTQLQDVDKKRLIAEGRFLRANIYFELVKRMGGVPLITKSLTYVPGSDPASIQFPRAKESEVYDYVISELEAIIPDLPNNFRIKDRATQGAALAMQSRAALYAASIAKYGGTTPLVTLPGDEVGIPASKANDYYTKALNAAKSIISGSAGAYALYNRLPNKSENFAKLFVETADRFGNPESIWIEDYKVGKGKTHGFTIQNQPIDGGEEVEGGRVDPSLNFVQTFELLDNTFAPIPAKTSGGATIYYTNALDIFANRDPRLGGTVVLPTTTGRSKPVDIFAGYQLADGSFLSGPTRGFLGNLPGGPTNVKLVGSDGPINGVEYTAQSGFYIRKFVDPSTGAGSRGTGSDVPWMRYRYAEVLLNAAEAAFELGNAAEAVGYINQVRRRAGFPTDLTAAQLTFDRIVNERRVELAFEGHYIFDRKRWRIAHLVLDGVALTEANLLANIGSATKRNTQAYSLWPYKVFSPGSPNDGKWMFRIQKNGLVSGVAQFQLGNYYSEIGAGIIASNPKLIRQPNQ